MEIKSLIDPEGGLVNRRIFADPEIYELERERLFARCWLYLGHECEVPNPGDFVTAYMGKSRSSLMPRSRRTSARLSKPLPPPRQPGVPRRPRQREAFHLLLSRLDLLH